MNERNLPTEEEIANIIWEERSKFMDEGPANSLSETWARKAARAILSRLNDSRTST